LENNIRLVEFIIRSEPHFERCERIWILNKLSEEIEKARLISLLQKHQESYVDIPFDRQAHFNEFFDPTGLPSEQKALLTPNIFQQKPLLQEWITRHKSQRLVGINQARNRALALGRQRSLWTLVLDGGVFFTRSRWEQFVSTVGAASTARIAIIPMRRVYDWEEAGQLCADEGRSKITPPAEQLTDEEPQMAFHCDSEEIFDERLRYGHRNKAELLVRLGVPGPWNEWKPAAWDKMIPLPVANEGNFVFAGSVVRLPADGVGKEIGAERYANRFQGVARRALEIDLQVAMSKRQPSDEFTTIIPRKTTNESLDGLQVFAAELLAKKDRFITDKAIPAPSGDLHDYYSVAPYWTARGDRVDGVLQVRREDDDDPTSGRFDRNSLKEFANRVYGLAISGELLGRREMLSRAAELVRLWLLDKSTRMNPTARYAQCIPGKDDVNDVGLIEFRHLALLPFAVRILGEHGALSSGEIDDIKRWFVGLLRDCESIGLLSRSLNRSNNIGTWCSVLYCSAALFVGNVGSAFFLVETASIRLGKQLGPFCIQSYECERTKPLHYSLFNLAAWAMMVQLAAQFSVQLQKFEGAKGESIAGALSFCSDNRQRFSDYSKNQGEYDYWIELLESIFSDSKTGEIATVKNSDFGIPPVVFL
jgi:hypothetical protein